GRCPPRAKYAKIRRPGDDNPPFRIRLGRRDLNGSLGVRKTAGRDASGGWGRARAPPAPAPAPAPSAPRAAPAPAPPAPPSAPKPAPTAPPTQATPAPTATPPPTQATPEAARPGSVSSAVLSQLAPADAGADADVDADLLPLYRSPAYRREAAKYSVKPEEQSEELPKSPYLVAIVAWPVEDAKAKVFVIDTKKKEVDEALTLALERQLSAD